MRYDPGIDSTGWIPPLFHGIEGVEVPLPAGVRPGENVVTRKVTAPCGCALAYIAGVFEEGDKAVVGNAYRSEWIRCEEHLFQAEVEQRR